MTKLPNKFAIFNKCHVGSIISSLVTNYVWERTCGILTLNHYLQWALNRRITGWSVKTMLCSAAVGPFEKPFFLLLRLNMGKQRKAFLKTNCCRSKNAQRWWFLHTSKWACFILKSPVMAVANVHMVHPHKNTCSRWVKWNYLSAVTRKWQVVHWINTEEPQLSSFQQ